MSLTHEIAKRILARLDSLEPKTGKKRDKAAVDLAVGAFIALEASGHREATHVSMLPYMTAVRGASWIAEVAARIPTEIAPDTSDTAKAA